MPKLRIVFLFAGVFILSVACSSPEEDAEQEEELTRTVNVETELVQPDSFERYLRLIGTVESENDIQISAEVSGRIEQYMLEKGDQVQKGEVIAKIDDRQLASEKRQLEAATARARENYERQRRIYEEDGIGSELDYLNAFYEYEQNKASLESVEVNLEKTEIIAPFDATIENILVEEGEMVSNGTPILRLIGTQNLKITAGAPSRYADVIHKGDRADVWFDSAQNDTLSLPITFVANSIDPQARTFAIDVALPGGGQDYKVDMNANINVQTLREEDVLVVSEEYLSRTEDGYVLFVAEENDEGQLVARERPVKLGASYQNRVVIEEGLETGMELITIGSSLVQNNVRINVVDELDEFAQSN